MAYALAFAAVYLYGAGVAFPVLCASLMLTVASKISTRVLIAFIASLGWPVLVVLWLITPE